VTSPECRGLIFETKWQEKVFFVGVGVGGVESQRLWMSEISQMVLGILSDVMSLNKEIVLAQVESASDIKGILRLANPNSKVMLLGNMTKHLQNSIIQELNVS